MNPWVSESPTVTSRCFVGPAAAVGTSIPRVGSVTGSRGLVWISTSSGVARWSAIGHHLHTDAKPPTQHATPEREEPTSPNRPCLKVDSGGMTSTVDTPHVPGIWQHGAVDESSP